MEIKNKDFEVTLTRAVSLGLVSGLGGWTIAFLWIDARSLRWAHLYGIVTIFLMGLGVINVTRDLLVKKHREVTQSKEGALTFMKIASIFCAFCLGTIFAFLTVLAIFLLKRG